MLSRGRVRKFAAFTLIELLVVIAIIAVLIALLLPAVQKVREASNRSSCQNNLRQLAIALHSYADAHKVLPQNFHNSPDFSWNCEILPYIEQSNIRFDLKMNWNSGSNLTASRTAIAIFKCPSTPSPDRVDAGNQDAAISDYPATGSVTASVFVANGATAPSDLRGALHNSGPAQIAHILDGTSNTMMLGEDAGRPILYNAGQYINDTGATDGAWAVPGHEIVVSGWNENGSGSADDGSCAMNCTNHNELYSFHAGGVNIAFCDGSVRFLTENVPGEVIGALVTRAGGEVLPQLP